MTQVADQFRQEFIAFAIEKEVLRFGEFKTKAGRLSPYFFNAGLFNDGESLMKLGEFYAEAIKNSGIEFDMLFGPAYKGITLVASIAIAFAKNGHNLPYAYNRKEAKDHGEGGIMVGSPLKGKYSSSTMSFRQAHQCANQWSLSMQTAPMLVVSPLQLTGKKRV